MKYIKATIFLIVSGLVFPGNLSAQEEINITVADGIEVSGTLMDSGKGKLVIFIAGSGPTDRDCNNAGGLKTDAFKMLAKKLADQNISSYRFDKRGIGKSTKVAESGMILHDFISDVSRIVDHFAEDYGDITLLGHSEGALIGAKVASEHSGVASLISVSGVSESLDKVVLTQLSTYPALVPEAELHIKEVKEGLPLSEVNPMLVSLFRPSVVPYLKSTFEIDPVAVQSAVQKPTLIIGGKCDVQVPATHAEALHKSGKEATLLIIDNMGHTMKTLKEDCSDNMSSYADPSMELHEGFVKGVMEFLGN